MAEKERRDRFPTPDLVATETGRTVPEQQAYLNLVRTAEVLSGQLAELLAAHGLSGKQYNVLRAIRRGGPEGLTAGEIGEQMTDPRADVTRLADRLVRDGLIERRQDPADRRVVRALLTERARDLLAAIDAPLLDLHRRQLGHLAPEELATLTALLRRARGEE